ncbi:type II secretion system protein [Mucisphaera calidilacus]|uniref:Prepilin-type N-terminal cleavage/methylation domain-containing protein n=1 Tax=Mucisphaera calidilacus TaxID=2527982 RepID=A0A518BW83_9BACT|nr:hypothetical protein [Mucisphaera calidilacus]QDU71243.1 hypothetical protein Pan265_10920 [Mucisphaera calidilacus]
MHARRGLTLLELLIAVSSTAVIALAGAAMLSALGYAASEQRDLRAVVGKSLAVGARVGAEIREAHAILAAENNLLILWQGDWNDDQQVDLSEIIRLDVDAVDQTLKAYTIGTGSNDVAYALTADFAAETQARIDAGDMAGLNWSRDVAAAVFTPNNANPQQARLVTVWITFNAGSLNEVYASAVALRDGGV